MRCARYMPCARDGLDALIPADQSDDSWRLASRDTQRDAAAGRDSAAMVLPLDRCSDCPIDTAPVQAEHPALFPGSGGYFLLGITAAQCIRSVQMLKGGCLCGGIRYEAGGTPFHLTSCHCSICRRSIGAPFVAWFSAPRFEFRFVQGMPNRFRSTSKGTRTFCPRCGTQLTFEHDDASDEIDVTTCSLDDPEHLPPEDHTRTSSKLKWVRLADGLREYREARSEG